MFFLGFRYIEYILSVSPENLEKISHLSLGIRKYTADKSFGRLAIRLFTLSLFLVWLCLLVNVNLARFKFFLKRKKNGCHQIYSRMHNKFQDEYNRYCIYCFPQNCGSPTIYIFARKVLCFLLDKKTTTRGSFSSTS